MLKKNPDPRVSVFTVWQPKRGGTRRDVAEATGTMPDERAHHYWDEDGFTLRAFAKALELAPGRDAWDVYLIYGPETRWDGPTPPAPGFWMHQLNGVTNAPPLDADIFAGRLTQALSTVSK